jgi:hypothetical protein
VQTQWRDETDRWRRIQVEENKGRNKYSCPHLLFFLSFFFSRLEIKPFKGLRAPLWNPRAF